VPYPAFALGGVTPDNAAPLGAAGVAFATSVLHEVDDAWVLGLLSAMS
jgi:thiamine monophosphate synthase